MLAGGWVPTIWQWLIWQKARRRACVKDQHKVSGFGLGNGSSRGRGEFTSQSLKGVTQLLNKSSHQVAKLADQFWMTEH